MARFKTTGLDELIRRMQDAGDYADGRLAQDMLFAGAEKVKEAWKHAAEQHHHKFSGKMIDSIGFARKVKVVGDIRSVDIYPQGSDGKVRNMQKAAWTHYGTNNSMAAVKRRHGRIVAHPKSGSHWIDDADRECETTVVPAMEKVYEDFLKKKGLK